MAAVNRLVRQFLSRRRVCGEAHASHDLEVTSLEHAPATVHQAEHELPAPISEALEDSPPLTLFLEHLAPSCIVQAVQFDVVQPVK